MNSRLESLKLKQFRRRTRRWLAELDRIDEKHGMPYTDENRVPFEEPRSVLGHALVPRDRISGEDLPMPVREFPLDDAEVQAVIRFALTRTREEAAALLETEPAGWRRRLLKHLFLPLMYGRVPIDVKPDAAEIVKAWKASSETAKLWQRTSDQQLRVFIDEAYRDQA